METIPKLTKEEQKYFKLLKQFLKVNNAFHIFAKNCRQGYTPGYNLADFPTDNWISISFAWCDTSQGCDYWYSLHKKWEHLLRTLEQEDT